ncbi:MAG: UbiA family prenyltransferase [Patescibacteria group bacterium]
MIKDFYELTKPGIVYGNLLTLAAGFFIVSRDILLFLASALGLALVIGSACVFNNYYDKDIDARMERTRHRALAAGRIATKNALIYAAFLGCAGFAILFLFTNLLAFGVALLGYAVYVALYTPLKHKTGLSLFVGAIAGATPPVVGYAAAAHTLDSTALWLFMFLFVWQLVHFAAIAIYRSDEYAAAGVPLFVGAGRYSAAQKRAARLAFYGSLVVLVVWSAALLLLSFSASH